MAEEEATLIRPVRSQTLDLPPSCVEFCPVFPSYFLVGTYSLQPDTAELKGGEVSFDAEEGGQTPQPKQPQSRNGSIIAFRLEGANLIHLQTVSQPSALLDLRFSPHDGHRNICAVVSSTATLALYRVSPSEQEPLRHINTMGITAMSHGEIQPTPGEEILFTSFGWHPSQVGMMAITTSTGHVYLVQLANSNGDWELNSEPVITHTLEAWCTVISPIPAALTWVDETQKTEGLSFRVYSGGDDSMLRSRTCNWNEGSLAQSLPALESRGHDAGVTAILPLFAQDGHELVVTGSYDEHIRLFLVPPFGRPKNLAEGMLGGGVWRLNLIDLDTKSSQSYSWRVRILASCMHAGTRVVELLQTATGEYVFKVLGRFEEHKSMNYGSDFQPGWKNRLSVVSTSFYDKLLCLWEFEIA